LFKWDGKFPIPREMWERVVPIRNAVLGTIEDLAPKSNSYVFTNVLEDDEAGATVYGEQVDVARTWRKHNAQHNTLLSTIGVDAGRHVSSLEAPT
jgi:hypothetical protein